MDRDYLVEAMLWCRPCRRLMCPTPTVDGVPFYDCGAGCPLPPIEARLVDQHVLLGGYVRGCVVLHRVGRAVTSRPPFHDATPAPVSTEELARWLRCDLKNPRAVIRAAYARIEVDARRKVHPIPHAVSAGVS